MTTGSTVRRVDSRAGIRVRGIALAKALVLIACGFVLCLAAAIPAAAEDGVIIAYAQTVSQTGFEAEFTVRGKPRTKLLRLANPDRIAIDFEGALPATKLAEPLANPLVDGIRHGLVAADRYRVIFHLKRAATASIETTDISGGQRISLSIGPAASAVAATVSPPLLGYGANDAAVVMPDKGVATAEAATVTNGRSSGKRLKIVVDPGHGGIDNGAVSKSGTMEKNINLAVAKSLKQALMVGGNVDVVLTRDDDTFIPLEERSAIGRREKADLFISVHADSIHYGSLRGATVYTLSENASDALSRQIAASENAADRFAGAEWQNDKPDVFDILVDLTRRETVSFSEHFAASLVDDLAKNDVRLITRPKRSAGFRVLKAPDVPSVLVEMGFLSNPEDEKLLKDDAWRHRIGEAIADAVLKFFRGKGATEAAKAR